MNNLNTEALQNSKNEYVRMRENLQRHYAASVPDQAAISTLISELEQVQLRIKFQQTGIKGNNPNE